MKQLLAALLLGVSSIVYSQDTLQIPAMELEEFFLALDTLRTQDSIKAVLINDLEYQIILHEQLNQQDSLIVLYKDQEIELLNEQINLYIDRLNKVDKWYNKPWIGVTGGFLGTVILINTINYTLPD
ncbi:hypothetical protein OAA40_00485 [bacterium]|nr:hypothetical protein [bacterium]MDB4346178.1 hypothetical protein [bacterium]|tara:strand:+ start:825 stop:1205 length:381 start_codon:yes stop_codon:yes gene_type:complete